MKILYKLLLLLILSTMSLANKSDILTTFLIVEKGQSSNVIILFKEENEKINGYILDISNKESPKTQLYDINNKNKELRSQPLIGSKIVKDFTYDPKTDSYVNGKIYDPTSGYWFHCSAYIKNNKLHLRGSLDQLGIFGMTRTWSKTDKVSF